MARKGTSRNQIQTQQTQPSAAPSGDEIAARAYEIYEREGRVEGRDLENWLKAETELKAEREGATQQSRPAGNGASSRMQSR